MFENLTEKLTATLRNLSGRGRLTEDNISETLRDIRIALLEADVALSVITEFLSKVKEQALGQQIVQNIRPGEALVKIVQDELTNILGTSQQELNLKVEPPAVILLAGLQGSGKTTTTAKLANLIKTDYKKSVLIASTDIYRPAALQQLETLAQQIDVSYFPAQLEQKPAEIATHAIAEAKKRFIEVVIIDTAGRLHIDNEMMAEIKTLHNVTNPSETLFVVDSMTGQDAANTAKAFGDALPLTGVILTKTDGDARGGAALSVRIITGKPIKFIGVGEKIDAFESFHPDRIASRILGMGDIVSLVEEAQKTIDEKRAKKMAKKFIKGKGFDLEDFRQQLQQLHSMGGISKLLDKLPGGVGLPKGAMGMVDDKMFTKMSAIINSMTLQERRFPAIIKGSRKRRIASGSGTQVQDINHLLKQFTQMQKMVKKFKGSKMLKMMAKLQGGLPAGL